MKTIYIKNLIVVMLAFNMTSCVDMLDEPVYSQLAPDNLLTTEEGIKNVLYSAYAHTANMSGASSKAVIAMEEWQTDLMWQTGGGENGTAVQFINFTLDPGLGILFSDLWAPNYRAIRNANIILENINNLKLSDQKKNEYSAEARFIRAISYIKLYNSFGPVPIRRSTTDELEVSRPSIDEMKLFIEEDLLFGLNFLPQPGSEDEFGRANKGAALAFLSKFYLQEKNWQKVVDYTNQLVALGYYSLYPVYQQMFKVENERNSEMIWVRPAYADATRSSANDWMNGAFPVGFQKDPVSGLEFQSNWVVFASEYRMRDQFYNTFSEDDKRKDLIITSFINKAGDTIQLLGDDNTRSFKYWPDPNAIQQAHGTDIPVIRYADILLAKAEALNEISGPNEEALNLINQVRERAGLNDSPLALSNFPSKESLREHILKERGWEFYSEATRRLDMIRMGVLISDAQKRGISNAQGFRTLLPIPQQAIDSNPVLIQNEGY
ncbi:RagB/SusD family nutrient uptake outer membrane protein [Algoriphagus aquimarinus]|uniref:RagB/SusD family nutrient uptake outer membrane protein n=1 Tax=Algoriphagus aquimarinus TaxID=237018 RepID=UPI0030D8A7F8|tara:strand:+ start:59484 stop:60962 length:1479 start_codon:yes stop_codon:yes gene_type:complete